MLNINQEPILYSSTSRVAFAYLQKEDTSARAVHMIPFAHCEISIKHLGLDQTVSFLFSNFLDLVAKHRHLKKSIISLFLVWMNQDKELYFSFAYRINEIVELIHETWKARHVFINPSFRINSRIGTFSSWNPDVYWCSSVYNEKRCKPAGRKVSNKSELRARYM